MGPAYTVIPAVAEDQKSIRQLIRAVRINPFGLKWQNFVVIKDDNGRLLATGQLKPRRDGSIELASIAVVSSHRKQGLARLIIESLLAQQPPPVYLMCESKLKVFYEQFGFKQETAVDDLPPFFKRIFKMAQFAQKLSSTPIKLAIMSLRTNALAKNP
ncbi:MAG: GNAT family N-acetyltransferase [Chloroflexota bacterium]